MINAYVIHLNLNYNTSRVEDCSIFELLQKWLYLTKTRRDRGGKKINGTAIAAVRENIMGYLKEAKLFNVPRSILFRSITDKDSPIEAITNRVIGRRLVFGQEKENLLIKYGLTIEKSTTQGKGKEKITKKTKKRDMIDSDSSDPNPENPLY
ncbi:hypothetical protein HHI36_019116 [Cryptolaemus montrouzieri]|uniref:Uncharacterized protein n=1 Tax=Cryptolaemus montrouzieri TaxID=559131 RepID=A0ABD2P2H9_9CUCU